MSENRSKATLTKLQKMKRNGEKIACLTCYDATFSKLMSDAGVDAILVGDSLGMVVQGGVDTLSVSVNDICYHLRAVSGANSNSLIIGDMPFLSTSSPETGLKNAGKLMKAGAGVVKLEGGVWLKDTLEAMSNHGIPTCVHLGLKPQTVYKIGGYKVRGKSEKDAEEMFEEACLMESYGADMLLFECIPSELADRISKHVKIPVIGIGAGSGTDGQILVMHDMLGLTPDPQPRFVKNYMKGAESIKDAFTRYVREVKDSVYPSAEQSY